MAVIECEATANEERVSVACAPLNVAVPILFEPSRKAIVPLGNVEPDDGLTVAVSVTDWPKTDGLAEEAMATDVGVLVDPVPVPVRRIPSGAVVNLLSM